MNFIKVKPVEAHLLGKLKVRSIALLPNVTN